MNVERSLREPAIVWLPALLLMSIGVSGDGRGISELLSTGGDVELDLHLTPLALLPLLAAWLGAKHGRAALLPALAATPFLALRSEFALTESWTLTFGAGLPMTLAMIAAVVLFSRPLAKASLRPLGGVLATIAALALPLALSFSIEGRWQSGQRLLVTLGSEAEELLALGGFVLCATGRPKLIWVSLGVTGACIALWLSALGGPLPRWASHVDGPLGWTAGAGDPVKLLPIGLAAAFAGTAARALRGGEGGRRGLALAAIALLVAAPPLIMSASLAGRQALAAPQIQATDDAPQAHLAFYQEQQDVVVTGSRTRAYDAQEIVTAIGGLAVLGVACFVVGVRSPRSGPPRLPLAIEGLAFSATFLATVYLATRNSQSGFEVWVALQRYMEFQSDNLLNIMSLGVVGWIYGWFGARRGSQT